MNLARCNPAWACLVLTTATGALVGGDVPSASVKYDPGPAERGRSEVMGRGVWPLTRNEAKSKSLREDLERSIASMGPGGREWSGSGLLDASTCFTTSAVFTAENLAGWVLAAEAGAKDPDGGPAIIGHSYPIVITHGDFDEGPRKARPVIRAVPGKVDTFFELRNPSIEMIRPDEFVFQPLISWATLSPLDFTMQITPATVWLRPLISVVPGSAEHARVLCNRWPTGVVVPPGPGERGVK